MSGRSNRRERFFEFCNALVFILVGILLIVLIIVFAIYKEIALSIAGLVGLGSNAALYWSGLRCYCFLRIWDFFHGLIWRYVTGPPHVVVSNLIDLLQRNRSVWEIASALFELLRRIVTRVESIIDNIRAGQPENVRSPPEDDAAIADELSISNQDEAIRRTIYSEQTLPLIPPHPVVTEPRPTGNVQHRNPSRPDFQSTIAPIPAPASVDENRNLTSKESESSTPDVISTSATSLPGPSGLQWRRTEESTETGVDPHSRSSSSELHVQAQHTTEQLHNPAIACERLPTTRQPVIRENLPGQLAQTEESTAVNLRTYRATSPLDELRQAEQNDPTSEESSV